MTTVPRRVAGKYAGKYPDRVIRAAEKLYGEVGGTGMVAKELGLPASIVRYWRSRYGWPKPPQPLSEMPKQWWCECGRRCVRALRRLPICVCGIQPAWGKPLEDLRHLPTSAHDRGEAVHGATLTEAQVREIRVSTLSLRKLAFRYGVTAPNIAAIRNGKTWQHVL